MASEKFPFNYRQRYNQIETINYIGKYLVEVHNFLTTKKNFIYVNPPILFNIEVNGDQEGTKERKINFDSKFNSEIYQLYEQIEIPFNQMTQKYLSNKNETIYTYYNQISRDIAHTNISGIISNNFYIEFKVVEEEIKISNIQQIASHYLMIIKEINKKISELTNVKTKDYNDTELKFVPLEEIDKLSRWSSLKNQIKNYVEKSKLLLVTNAYHKNKQGEFLLEKQNNFSDLSLTSILFVWDEVSHAAVPILKVLPHSIEGKTGGKSATIAVEILFSNLMKINLEKHHIAEVTNSSWGKNFYEFLKNKKIEIL